MSAPDFVHRTHRALEWEEEVKSFIQGLATDSTTIWYRRDRMLKKVSQELVLMGYYVKYKYANDDSITFLLNPEEGAADGWVFRDGDRLEAVQLTIAYYEKAEAEIDELLEIGQDVCQSGWILDRFVELAGRIERRIQKKCSMQYENISTLVVGVDQWFVRSVKRNYPDLVKKLEERILSSLPASNFEAVAIVDSDLVGKGDVWLFSQRRAHEIRR